MKRFVFFRKQDVSGVSGTGFIVEGVQFSDGRVVLRWNTKDKPSSLVIYNNIDEAIEIHGHEGRTEIRFID